MRTVRVSRSAVFKRVVLCLVVVTSISVVTPSAHSGVKKVLTIGVDGLRPDALIAASTPNIDSLLDGTFFGTGGPSGMLATYAQAEHLTFSGPGWGSYMTGLHVDRHGADTNGFENVVPGTTDWFTPLEAHNSNLNTYRAITWLIAHTSIPSGADRADNFEYNVVINGKNGDQRMTDSVVHQMMGPTRNIPDNDAVMTFYADVDTAGHSCGFSPTAPCYLAEISDVDGQIGEIMTAMASRPSFANEDWLVILTSDHGGIGTGHSGGQPLQRTIPFFVAGPLATTVLPQANPRQPDVGATVLEYFGAPMSNLDGHAVGLTAAGPAPATLFENLIFNGDAEFDRGFATNSRDQYASGWDDPGPGGVNIIAYDAGGGFPDENDPGPPDRGSNMFGGGSNVESAITQSIDVSNLGVGIDASAVGIFMSAYLGGYFNQDDSAMLTATFLDSNDVDLGNSVALGPVTADDRGNVTSLLLREALDLVPAGTRSIEVELRMVRTAGGDNDGYADDLTLELRPFLSGDFDLDGNVRGDDFLFWQRNPSVGSLADWEASYGTVSSITASSTAVPEPATEIVLLIGMLALLYRRDLVVS